MQCVINLTMQFFFIHLLLWIFFTLDQFDVGLLGQSVIADAMEAARQTVQYVPMLEILFVATCVRVLQLSKNLGAPRGCAQEGMSWRLG